MTASESNCTSCPLHLTRRRIVDGQGDPRSELMVVLDAPRGLEEEVGSHLVGRSGQFVQATLSEYGARMEDVFVTSAVRCRPPGDRGPTIEEIDACKDWLLDDLTVVIPKVILALGLGAQKAVMGAMDDQGWNESPRLVFAPHPVSALFSKTIRVDFEQKVRYACEEAGITPVFRGALRTPPGPPAVVPTWTYGIPDLDSPWLSADTETDDLTEGWGVRMVGWSLSDGKTGIFETNRNFPKVTVPVHLWNAKYDLPLLGLNARDLDSWEDGQLALYQLRWFRRVGLKPATLDLTGIQMTPIKDILTYYDEVPILTKKGNPSFSRKTGLQRFKRVKREVPFSEALILKPEEARRYATEDAVGTSLDCQIVFTELRKDPGRYRYYREVEKPIVPILMDMEHRGLKINPDQILSFKHGLEEDKAIQEEILLSELGDINLNSNRQVAQALIARGIPLVETTETGEIATGKEVLLAAVGVHDPDDLEDFGPQGLVKDLLLWGNLDKMIGTYANPILEGLDPDSRIHPRFNQMVTNTNRLSSSNPNAQNMPSKGRHGRNIRRAFVVKSGYKLFKADYSQLELRILAHLTQEPVLLRAYRSEPEEDVHQLAADALHLMGKDGRKTAKIANFAFAYGAGDSGIARQTHRSMDEVKELMDRYRRDMPRFYGFKKVIASLLDQDGFVESLGGWRMYFPEWTSPVGRERATALREATNGPIQSTAAWLVKLLMIAFDREIAEKYDVELDNQVHDEIVGAVPEGAVAGFSEDLEQLGREVALPYLSVPLKLEVEIGDNWYDVKPWKEYLAV